MGMARALRAVAGQARPSPGISCRPVPLLSASAVDWFAIVRNKEVTIKNILKIWITDDIIADVFHPYHTDPGSDGKTFVECSIDIAKKSNHCTKTFAELE